MKKKTWIVWALFLMLPGIIGLSIRRAQKSAVQSRITLAAQQVAGSSVAQEYLQMYEQWCDLPAGEKANNPWGYGSYGGADIQKRLVEGQSDRLTADLPTLEKGFANYPNELSEMMYGPEWRQEVERYKKEQSMAEIFMIGSAFLLAGGGLILAGGFAKLLAVHIIKKRSERTEVPDNTEASESIETSEDADVSDLPSEDGGDVPEPAEDIPELVGPRPQSVTDASSTPHQKENDKSEGACYFQSSQKSNRPSTSNDFKATDLPMKPTGSLFGSTGKSKKDSYFGWAVEPDESAELDTLMTTEPLTKELTELTEEVSAIRQFAANQQDQMRKLQDGYDWMIIRRFSLRIIRCIDNIDDRVTRLYDQGEEAVVYLEDIRDELVFALEAGGIEQFGPDSGTPFKGLEKYAEAVRERVFTENAEQAGCIAEVVRPGYQYLVNDDDVKIVRCAQVKLYESKQT